jgi:hypothetical protein
MLTGIGHRCQRHRKEPTVVAGFNVHASVRPPTSNLAPKRRDAPDVCPVEPTRMTQIPPREFLGIEFFADLPMRESRRPASPPKRTIAMLARFVRPAAVTSSKVRAGSRSLLHYRACHNLHVCEERSVCYPAPKYIGYQSRHKYLHWTETEWN